MNMHWRHFFFILLPFLTLLLSPSFKMVSASINDNVRGLASSSLGYISFNCLDDNFFGYFPFTFPFRFNVPPCSFSPFSSLIFLQPYQLPFIDRPPDYFFLLAIVFLGPFLVLALVLDL